MKRPHWFRAKKWIVGPDIPEAYVRLLGLTNVYDPYKRKAVFLFFVGVAVIIAIDIPGLFFTNPYTHVVEGPALYLGILGATMIGVLGMVTLWQYQHVKDTETMAFTFGAFNLRARKNLRVPFHAITGTIERVKTSLATEMSGLLDSKLEELRQAQKVQPLEGDVLSPEAAKLAQETAKVVQQKTTALTGLHAYYIPFPGLLEKCHVPGVLHLSKADVPEKLQCPLPGEWIWEGWMRHGKGEVWDLGVLAEWQYTLPGQTTIYIVPITAAAGTYYEFVSGLEHAFSPVQLNATELQAAKNLASARVVGLEAVNQLQVFQDAWRAESQVRPTLTELATDISGGILDLIYTHNRPGEEPARKRKVNPAVYLGLGIIIFTLVVVAWAAFHGWKL